MHRIALIPALLSTTLLAAQTVCDSIHVDSLRYAPFGDGLQISLYNESAHFLSGPTVDVIDADGDTIVQGFQEFFVIMQGPSLHQVHFSPQPASPFTGTVVVNYYDDTGWVHCDVPVTDVDLCPTATACIPLEVYAYMQGGNPVDTDLDWSVTNAQNEVQASGVLHIDDASFGFATAEICLPPGEYVLHISQGVAAGDNMQVGLTQAGFAYTDGTGTQLVPGGNVDHPFSYYIHCADGTQGIATNQLDAITLIVDGRTLRISTNNGSALGKLVLLDGMGKIVRSITTNSGTTFSDLSGFASGAYVLRSLDDENHWPAQRFILP